MNHKILLETYFNTYNLIFTDIVKDNITFKFIKEYPQITTPEYKLLLYDYLKNLIIQNINNITIMQYNNIINLLEENDIIITDINNLVDIIKSDDFYYTDDVLNIIYPKKSALQLYMNNNGVSHQNINFVVDAYSDFKDYIITKQKTNNTNNNSIYTKFNVERSTDDISILYLKHIKFLYNIYEKNYWPLEKDSITDIFSFIKSFINI